MLNSSASRCCWQLLKRSYTVRTIGMYRIAPVRKSQVAAECHMRLFRVYEGIQTKRHGQYGKFDSGITVPHCSPIIPIVPRKIFNMVGQEHMYLRSPGGIYLQCI